MVRRQRALAEFGEFVLVSDDVDAILDTACRLVAKALGTDLAKVVEIEDQNDTALVRAGYGWKDGVVGKERVSLAKNSSEAFAIEQARPVITNDVSEETRFHLPRFLREHGVKALVNVPIFLPGRLPWGLLQVDARERRDFDNDDIDFLKTYALILGPVINRLEAIRDRDLAQSAVSERERRLRGILDAMGECFGLLAPDFTILEFNGAAARMDGRPSAEIIGRSHWEVYPGSEDWELGRVLKSAMIERKPIVLEHNVPWNEDRHIWLEVRAYPAEDGNLAVFWRDVTDRRDELEATQKSEEWLRSAIGVGKIGLWDWNLASGEVSWSDEHYRMQGYNAGEVAPTYEAWLTKIHEDDQGSQTEAIRRCMESGDDYASEYRVIHRDGTVRWVRARGRFFFDENKQPLRMVGAAIDITEPRELQDRLGVLVAELQHRTRNLMGVVNSLCDRTARGSNDFNTFRTKYRSRLDALARVQSLLSRLNPQDRITFDELIENEMKAMNAAADVRLTGPTGVRLRSSTVQILGMALHELATNALKYGALGQEGGKLVVEWRLNDKGDDGMSRLHIEWRESNVKMPQPDKLKRGQGRELIEHALPYQLAAQTNYEMTPDGIHCTLSVPISETTDNTRH